MSWAAFVVLPDGTSSRVLLVWGILSLKVGKYVCTLDVTSGTSTQYQGHKSTSA